MRGREKSGRNTHLPVLPKPSPDESARPNNPQTHVDAIRPHQALPAHLQHAQEQVCGGGEAGKEAAHPHALAVQVTLGGDAGDEGLGDAVQRQQRHVVAVARQRLGRRRVVGPARACYHPQQQRRQRWPQRARRERDEPVQVHYRLQDDARLPYPVLGRLLAGFRGRAQPREEVAAALLDGLEEHARDEATVVGGQGVGALIGERGERRDEDGVALREDVLDAGLEVQGEAELAERAREPVEDVFFGVAGKTLVFLLWSGTKSKHTSSSGFAAGGRISPSWQPA